MKIITLNTWAGQAGLDKLEGFFEKYIDSDVFCLQEIWNIHKDVNKDDVVGIGCDYAHTYFDLIKGALPDYQHFFHPHYSNCFGLATFVKNSHKVISEGEVFVYKNKGEYTTELKNIGTHARNIQHVTIEKDGEKIMIINFHGLWNGQGKSDSEDRLKQSDKIANFLKNVSIPYVLTGDFNLLPDTESIKKLEGLGLRNLIKENKVTSTRTSLYKKPLRYADYTFVSDGIEVKEFKVLPDVVSDHSALYLEIE